MNEALITIYLSEVFYLFVQLVLAGKDAIAYLMKSAALGPLTAPRLKRWHRDGILLATLYLLPFLYMGYRSGGWKSVALVSLGAILIRLSIYDVAFNRYSGLPATFFGTTTDADKYFVKVFGRNGAVRKALTFAIALVAFQFIIKIAIK